MQNQFERIVELLGQTPHAQISRKFTDELGETPRYQSGCYIFPKAGFMLFCYKNKFVMACFHINRLSPEGGYRGNMPSGISWLDKREDVQRKLGVAPVQSKFQSPDQRALSSVHEEIEDWYSVYPLRLWFTFNPENNSLTSFTVRYDSENNEKSTGNDGLWSGQMESTGGFCQAKSI